MTSDTPPAQSRTGDKKTDRSGKVDETLSLFYPEEQVMKETRETLTSLDNVANGVQSLADAYREAYRVQRKLLRMSDRMHNELMVARQNLQLQASELETLNAQLVQEIREKEKLHQELKEREKELVASRDALARTNDQKDRFFSIIAHDLRTPFAGFLGMAELLRDSSDDLSQEEMTEYGEICVRSAKHSLELVENLLEWARVQMGRSSPSPHLFPLSASIDAVMAPLSPLASQKGIHFANLAEECDVIFADKPSFETILRNLLSNAIKFTGADGKVTVSCAAEGKFCRILVRDTGKGIAADQIESLFDVSVKTSTMGTDGEPGTGLGLPLVRELLVQNQGHIEIESQPGEGSCFIVLLPTQEPDSPDMMAD